MEKKRKHEPFNPEDRWNKNDVIWDPKRLGRHLEAWCPCSYCEAKRQDIENAGDRYKGDPLEE